MKPPTIRPLPEPNGCRWCGRDERGHGISWAASKGFHQYALPTDAQRKARMLARPRMNTSP